MRTLLAAIAATLVLAAPASAADSFNVAGGGAASPDAGGLATAADLGDTVAVVAVPGGAFLVADANRVYRVSGAGLISVVAGRSHEGTTPTTPAGIPGPAATALIGVADLAPLPGGGFLIADGSAAVLRVTPDGQIAYAAGTGEAGFAGDGGSALAAKLSRPTSVEPLPDGGFLIADAANNRVRRVAADGTIATIAGSGKTGSSEGGFGGDGGPATAALLSEPTGVAATGDGAILIADSRNQRLRRVAAEGTISTVAGNGTYRPPAKAGDTATGAGFYSIRWVTVAPDGAVLFAEDFASALWRLDTGKLVAGPAGDRVAFEADGGLLLASTYSDRVSWQPGSAPSRAGVVIDQRTLKLSARTTVRFRTTLAGQAKVVVRRGKRVVTTVTAAVNAGSNAVPIPAKLPAGTHYRVTVEVTSPDGRVATGSITVIPRGPLGTKTANAIADAIAAENTDDDQSAADAYEEFRSGSCVRVTRTRVDCEMGSAEDDVVSCDHVNALFLPKNGRVYYRQYRCPQRRGAKLGRLRLGAPENF